MARTVLTNRIALVLGIECAPGRAAAQQLSRAGCRVLLASRDENKLQQLGQQLQQKGGEPHLVVLPEEPVHLEEVLRKARELVSHIHLVVNALAFCGNADAVAQGDAKRLDVAVAADLIGRGPVRMVTLWPDSEAPPSPVQPEAWHGFLLLGSLQRLDTERVDELDATGTLHLRAGAIADTIVAVFQIPPSVRPLALKLECIPSIEKKS